MEGIRKERKVEKELEGEWKRERKIRERERGGRERKRRWI